VHENKSCRLPLKIIKMALKEWNLTHTNNLPGMINYLKESIWLLESKGDVEVLLEEEVEGLHGFVF